MRRKFHCVLLGMVAGVIVGVISAIRWVACLAAAGGPSCEALTYLQTHLFVCGVAFAAMIVMLWRVALRILPFTMRSTLLAAISLCLGGVCYVLIGNLARATEVSWPGSVPVVVCAFLLIAVVARLAGQLRISCAVLFVAAGFLPWCRNFQLVTADSAVLRAMAYASPLSLSYYLSLALSCALLGAVAGWMASLLTQASETRGIARGALGGLALAACVLTAQTASFCAAMGSGQDPKAIVCAMVAVWIAFGVTGTIAVSAWPAPSSSVLLKYLPGAVVLAVGTYACVALFGYTEYREVSPYHPDGIYAYIQLSADGVRRRTLDQSASRARSERAQLFLLRYPCSAYRPAALLLEARSQFEEWRFADASGTLSQLRREYPLLDGYRDILQAFSDLAMGSPKSLLGPVGVDSYFAKWRKTQGAQIVADAAVRVGLKQRAYGLHSAYIDYLTSARPTSWSEESAQFSRNSMDALSNASCASRRLGIVSIVVTGPSGPVRGARIVLVQPRPDAALPSDSMQFTGAWTIPAWGGIWGLTNNRGVATISGIPYGNYEIVVGLRFSTWPADTVISQAPSGVLVNSAHVEAELITMAPAVQLLMPAPGALILPSARLGWKAYPFADHYSATVMTVRNGSGSEQGEPGVKRGTTCWAKAGIRATSTTIDPERFVNGARSLQDGRSYMWVVCAYSRDGRLLASSEHYFELAECTFTIALDKTHKGGSVR